jgi:hypothetical protein
VDASQVIPAGPEHNSGPVVFHFFENAFVSLVNRLVLMRVLRLERSTIEMQMRSGSGCPMIGTTSVDATSAGE